MLSTEACYMAEQSEIISRHVQPLHYLSQSWLALRFLYFSVTKPTSLVIWQSYLFLVTSLTKALLPQLLSLARWPALGSVLVVPNFFHLRIMEATVFLGTFHAAEMFWYTSPDLCLDTIMSQCSTDNSVDTMAWFCCDMHCQLWHLIQTGGCLSKSSPIN